VFNGASAVIGGNTIQGNTLDGVNIGRAMGRLVGSNVIRLNSGNGISVSDTSSLFQAQGDFGVPNVVDTIQSNTLAGINVFNGSSLDVQNALIKSNGARGVSMSNNVSARFSSSTIQDNTGDGFGVFNASTLLFVGTPSNVSVTGNTGFGINCTQTESSFGGDSAGVVGNTLGQVSCSGF
jgi:hypothetical protein